MPRRIRAVVFDFGGVLITSIANQIGTVAASHGVDPAVLHEVLLGPRESGPDHPWHRAERGEIAVADIQGLLEPWAAAADVSLDGDEIERLMTPGQYAVVDEVVDRVRSLRREGYRTGLLTNTFAEFRPTMERDLDFSLFDVVIESFAVGSRKPEFEIYRTARHLLGVEDEAILYLDDFEQNLGPPEALGWATILVGDHHDALTALDSMLGRAPSGSAGKSPPDQ